MPQWLSVSLGLAAGLALVVGAVFVAFRPYVQARPPKPRMPDPSDSKDNYEWAGAWSSDNSNHSAGGDGHGQ
jgi:hypothetical protein